MLSMVHREANARDCVKIVLRRCNVLDGNRSTFTNHPERDASEDIGKNEGERVVIFLLKLGNHCTRIE